MKVLLKCKHCFAEHQISEFKVAGKHGNFRCIRCHALTPFSFTNTQGETVPVSDVQENSKNNITLFDLNFDQPIPKSPIRGQFEGSFYQEINVFWFENRVLFVGPDEKDLLDPKTFVMISGNLNPKKLKGLQFDFKPTDSADVTREVLVSSNYRANTGYRLSIYIEDEDPRYVKGRLYFAIPDHHNTYIYGAFDAKKIYAVKFKPDGSSDVILPDFLSNYLTAKVLLLSGNIIYIHDCFDRLNVEEKDQLFQFLVESWVVDDSIEKNQIKFFEENIDFEISISEKKLNEALVFMISNQVQVGDSFWKVLKKKIKKSASKDESYLQILKKRYPAEISKIFEDLSNRMVIPKDPSSILARDDAESLRALLDSGVSPNFIKENPDLNPLHFSLLQDAASIDSLQCALLLLESGADPNYLDIIGENSLFKLCQNNLMRLQDKMLLFEELLKYKVNINHRSQNQMTALHWCALFGEPSLTKKLIQAGIDIELTDIAKNTALHEACKFGNSSVLALLLEAGAKTDVHNDEHKTGRDLATEALEIAQFNGHTENQERMERILSLLKVYGG